MTFDEFAAAAKQLEHIKDCTIETSPYGVMVTVEAYMANEDGTRIERGRDLIDMTQEQFSRSRFSTPGPWLLQSFERAFKVKHQGFTRYAMPEEIARYKSAEQEVATC